MKKMLFVIPSMGSGGAEKSLINLFNEMDLNNVQIDLLIFSKKGLFLNQVPDGIIILEVPEKVRLLYTKTELLQVRSVTSIYMNIIKYICTLTTRLLKKDVGQANQIRWKYFYSKILSPLSETYDVAVSYLEGEAMYFVADKVKASKKIAWFHNDYISKKFDSKLDMPIFKKFDAIVTISDECKKILCEAFPEIKEKFIMLPNIVSEKFIRQRAQEPISDLVQFTQGTFSFISVGRLNYQKGFDMALEAAKLLKDRGYKYIWYIIGEGEKEQELRAQIQKYQLEKEFILLGARDNPYPYIKHSDIFVQTSRFEGKSIVLDEAKILCATILVTNYPTVKDQILEGEGKIVGMDPLSIANGLEELMNIPSLRESQKAMLIQRHYGNEECVRDYITLFEI